MLGILLLVAAALKLYGLNFAPFAQYGRLSNAAIGLAAVEWEIVLGLWLLSGRAALGAWGAALLTFLTFAGVSAFLDIIGQASCGCFGSVKASPWVAFGIDVAALGLLAIARPDFRTMSQFPRWQWVREFGIVAGAVAFCAGIMGLTSLAYGSPDAALARLRGERLSVRPGIVDIRSGEAGQIMEAAVEIVNRTDRPVKIFGGTSDCSCVTTKDLPLTLAPGEALQISVQVRLPASPGIFNRKAFLWTDCEGARMVLFGLTGRIDATAQESVGVSVE